MAAARSEPDLVTGVAVQRAGGRRAEHPLLTIRQRLLVLCPGDVITPLAVLHHGLSSLMGGMNGGARKRSGYFSPGRRCPGMTPASAHRFGGVVVAPHASELIHVLAVAVGAKITVDQLAQAFTVYPSLSGSIGEAARRLHGQGGAEQVIH